jgi:hypothetical protein
LATQLHVPFEVPDLSTNDVEVQKEIVPPKQLKDIFAKSLAEFRKPWLTRNADNQPQPKRTVLSGYGENAIYKQGLQLRLLDLVGLTNPDGPVVYSGGKAFELQRVAYEDQKAAWAKLTSRSYGAGKREVAKSPKSPEADDAKLETRPLDIFEISGVAELRQGKDLYIRHKDNAIRMLGALRATEQCLKCHGDNKKGDLLGAFSYTFVDTNKSLEKELTGSSAK